MRSYQLFRAMLLAATAFGCVLAACVGVPQAQAQFVCVGNTTGATVGPATAAGASATATGSTQNVACGTNADASGNAASNTAIGYLTDASGASSINTSTGFNADAFGDASHNTATGHSAQADGDGSNNTATGSNAHASGSNSNNTATGNFANASGAGSSNTATGDHANASGAGSNNTATGNLANASGAASANMASGYNANASGNSSANVGIGFNVNASGDFGGNTAVGAFTTATGANSSAFGNSASATFANSAAFGNGATATRANQQVFGTATNTYTMSGITSVASKSAQSGPTQIVTADAGGNLATSTVASLGLASSSDVSGINSRLDDLTTRSNKAYTGVAMAFAMAGVPTLMPNEKFAVTANWGTFEGTNGLALNGAARITDSVQFNAGISYGPNERIAGGRAGVRFGW